MPQAISIILPNILAWSLNISNIGGVAYVGESNLHGTI